MARTSTALKVEAHVEDMETGLDAEYRARMSKLLSAALADTYRLTIKSHLYHWNVVGPLFKPLHELTEEHYEALFEAADIIAERIRALGHLAPDDLSAAADFAPPGKSVRPASAEAMVEDLIAEHEEAARSLRKAGAEAGEVTDLVTEDMITQRLAFHEKALWMLRSTVAG